MHLIVFTINFSLIIYTNLIINQHIIISFHNKTNEPIHPARQPQETLHTDDLSPITKKHETLPKQEQTVDSGHCDRVVQIEQIHQGSITDQEDEDKGGDGIETCDVLHREESGLAEEQVSQYGFHRAVCQEERRCDLLLTAHTHTYVIKYESFIIDCMLFV